MKTQICACCGQTIKAIKPSDIAPRDTSTMSDAEVFAYYKRIAPLEDVRFWIKNARMSAALRDRFIALELTGNLAKIKRELPALQAEWRKESNVRERLEQLVAA